MTLPGLLAAVAVASPVLIGAAYSTLAAVGLVGVGAQGFTLDRAIDVLASAETWRGVAWTFATAGVATVIAVAVAFLLAVRVRGSRVGQATAMLPMAVPHVAAALAALLMFGQSGLLSRLAYALGLTSTAGRFSAVGLRPRRRVARVRVRLEGAAVPDAHRDGGPAHRHPRARGGGAHAGRDGAPGILARDVAPVVERDSPGGDRRIRLPRRPVRDARAPRAERSHCPLDPDLRARRRSRTSRAAARRTCWA